MLPADPSRNTKTVKPTSSTRPKKGSFETGTGTEQITTFSDAGSAARHTAVRCATIVPTTTTIETRAHTIEHVLARPIELAQGVITPATTTIGNFNLSNWLASSTVVDYLKNFAFLTGHFHVKIVINASPYTSGRLILASVPYWNLRGAGRLMPLDASHLTSCPYVDVDIGSGETGELVVDYSAPYPVLDVKNAPPDVETYGWSEVVVAMISPLASTDTAVSADFTVYGWCSKVGLTIPHAQSGSEATSEIESAISSGRDTYFDFNVNISPAPIRQDMEPPADETNLGWIAPVLKGASTFFGFDRPQNEAKTCPMLALPGRGMTHCVGSDDYVPLARRPDISVRNDEVTRLTCHDPMDAATFLNHYQYFTVVNWSASTAVGTLIFNTPLSPSLFDGTRLQFVSQQFRYWNGSLCFRLSAVKNAFCSGRLTVAYQGNGDVPTTVDHLPKIVWDLKTNKELQITVPFVNHTRFGRAGSPTVTGGRLVISVATKLRVATGAPTTVPILVFVSACHDINFAAPRVPSVAYAQGKEKSSTLATTDPPPLDNVPDKRIIDLVPSVRYTTLSDLRMCMGEPFLSMRDLITRYALVGQYQLSTLIFDPFNFGSNPNTQVPLWAMSWYYSYWRGSMKVKIVTLLPPQTPAGISCSSYSLVVALGSSGSGYAVPGPVLTPPLEGVQPFHITFPHLNPVSEVLVPFYSNVDRVPVSSVGFPGDTAHSHLQIYYYYDSTIFTVPPRFCIYVAAGEDFSFLYPAGTRTQL